VWFRQNSALFKFLERAVAHRESLEFVEPVAVAMGKACVLAASPA